MKLLNNLPKIDNAVKAFAVKNAIAIEVGDQILFSGMAGIELETGKLAEGDIAVHANASLDCYEYILESMGLTLDNVIKVNCFLANPADFALWNETFKSRFSAPYPCRTTVGAPLVAGEIELEIIATRTKRADATINA